MSYILDALRKADAERERGHVPGIHAQPSFGGAMPTSTQPAAKPWLWLVGGAGAMLLIGALAWYLTSMPRGGPEAAAPTTPTASPMTPAPSAATPPPVATTAVPAPTPPTPPNRSIAAKTEPTPLPVRKPKPALPASSAAPSADAKPAAAGDKVYTVAELPDDIRRQLPNVAVGGSMYSSKPADRILIINGQVLHEGDKVAPDLVLQQIRLKTALMNFKGYRYTIDF